MAAGEKIEITEVLFVNETKTFWTLHIKPLAKLIVVKGKVRR